METKINRISADSDEKLQKYFDTENLNTLHQMKLYTDDIYYNTGQASGLDDWQYDMLKDTLEKRDPNYVVPVGVRIREHENRVELPYWLGSMDKIKPEDASEIAKWLVENKAEEYILEDKLDGVSCLLILKDGKIRLYTRGDGWIGADISYLAQYFTTIPKKLKTQKGLELNVRGELIMKEKTFQKKYAAEYANPRNMVAGRIGAKTVRQGLKDIDFVAYEIVGDGVLAKPSDQLDYLDSLGFTTVRREITPDFSVDSLMETLVRFKETSPYEIDGIIVQPNEPYTRNTSGNPDYAFAFKMRLSGNLAEAEVLGVDWNVSKWGQLKPRVEIKPIELGGVTIKFATGFNAKFIDEESIGPGAVVEITRSGDVIPYIVRVVKKASEPDMPEIPYSWNETRVDIYTEEEGDVMCIKLIAGFFAKLGIKHVGEKNVEKMYNAGYDSLLKIIAASKSDLEQVPGFGVRMAERTYDNIHAGLKDLSLSTVLGSSGVFGFGLGRKKVATLMDDIPDLLDIYSSMSDAELYDRVMAVEGFSDKTTRKIVNNIEWANQFIQALSEYATFKQQAVVGDNMTNLKVVFSGFRDKKLEEEVVARGGKVTTSVSKNTTTLVIPSKGGKVTGKVQKAIDLGAEVMDKEEFVAKYIKR